MKRNYMRNKTISLIKWSKNTFLQDQLLKIGIIRFCGSTYIAQMERREYLMNILLTINLIIKFQILLKNLITIFKTISAKLQTDHARENLPFDLSKLTNYVDS